MDVRLVGIPLSSRSLYAIKYAIINIAKNNDDNIVFEKTIMIKQIQADDSVIINLLFSVKTIFLFVVVEMV